MFVIMLDYTLVSATHNNFSPLCADYRLILCKQDMKTVHIWATILQYESNTNGMPPAFSL